MDIQKLYNQSTVQTLLIARRRARARFFLSKVSTFPGMSVLDVGCGMDANSLESILPSDYTIVGIDLHPENQVKIVYDNFTYIRQDAEDLSRFHDKQFDLAVSVGMMEHICDRPKLLRIASEMNRVAKQVVINVPWKYGWFEPHFKVPFFSLLPWPLQAAITRTFNCNGYGTLARTSPSAFKTHFRQEYQWLSTSEWKKIFGAQKAYLSPTMETLVIVRTERL